MHCFHYFMRCLQILRLFNSLNLLRLVHIVLGCALRIALRRSRIWSICLSISECVRLFHFLFLCLHSSYRSVDHCNQQLWAKKERSQPQHHSPTNHINIIFIFVDSILLYEKDRGNSESGKNSDKKLLTHQWMLF